VSNALPTHLMTPSALKLAPRYGVSLANPNPTPAPRPSGMQPIVRPVPPPIPRTTPERMIVARDRIRAAAEGGQRIRSYEVALDLDLSEFHFARQFRAAFGKSPHVFYDEIRADRARELLREGLGEGEVARKIGFRRPAELRALLTKRTGDSVPPPPASHEETISV
jgi:AraC-like DNA-binding protein